MRIGRLGEFGFSASTDGGVAVGLPDLPPPPEVPSVSVEMSLEGEAISQGANGPPPNPRYAVALQSSPYQTMASRYAKYLAPASAPAGGRYAGASFAGSAEDYRGGAAGGAAPTYDRGVRYAAEGEVSTGAIVAGGAVLLALGALAAWRLGAFR